MVPRTTSGCRTGWRKERTTREIGTMHRPCPHTALPSCCGRARMCSTTSSTHRIPRMRIRMRRSQVVNWVWRTRRTRRTRTLWNKSHRSRCLRRTCSRRCRWKKFLMAKCSQCQRRRTLRRVEAQKNRGLKRRRPPVVLQRPDPRTPLRCWLSRSWRHPTGTARCLPPRRHRACSQRCPETHQLPLPRAEDGTRGLGSMAR
mmetsp:Transcript_4287/g.12736  ORF Transcript_4287/g.12736 Transcript_4287/m.12736 type:complete len:201 (+) Transcript_4287:677-1279(+)